MVFFILFLYTYPIKTKGEKWMNKISKFLLVILCCTLTLTTTRYTSDYEIMPTDHNFDSFTEADD